MGSTELYNMAERFWRGECTDQEEEQLRSNLLYGQVPQGLEDLADYMRFTSTEKETTVLSDEFDEKLLRQINNTGSERQGNYFLKIAAGIAIIVGVGFGIYTSGNTVDTIGDQLVQNDDFIDTFDDPELAYSEVKKALMFMSTSINEGLEPAEKLSEFHKAQNHIGN